MNPNITIPLFPLGVVLIPDSPLPLHIFEERYKLMINTCLDEQVEFGIVYFNGNEVSNIGCTARILKVTKRYDDGRMDIITRGAKRFIIHELFDEKAYLQAGIEYFDDIAEIPRDDLKDLASKGLTLLEQLEMLTYTGENRSQVDPEDFKSISFLIAGCEGFTHEEKQKFLEMTSTSQRLDKSVAALENIIQRLKLTAKIKKIIGGNGQVSESIQDNSTPH
jgi:Lon protease-like protein